MMPGGMMTEYLLAAKIALILGDTLIIHGALHTYNMGLVQLTFNLNYHLSPL